jgi:hypothetical protein
MVMKRFLRILMLAMMGTAVAHAAQLYRWVDGKGNVEWRDTPPPPAAAAKKVEERRVGGNVIDAGDSFAVQQATKNHPITFWSSTDCGKVCDGARAHLTRRGVPFTDKEVKSDIEGFNKISPNREVPILQVGVITIKGYQDSEWDSTLDNAGYPRTIVARPKPAAKPAAAPAAPAAAPAEQK